MATAVLDRRLRDAGRIDNASNASPTCLRRTTTVSNPGLTTVVAGCPGATWVWAPTFGVVSAFELVPVIHTPPFVLGAAVVLHAVADVNERVVRLMLGGVTLASPRT